MAEITFSSARNARTEEAYDLYWYLVLSEETWEDTPIQSGSEAWGSDGVDFAFTQANGAYKLLVYSDLDDDAVRGFGDDYLELDVVIDGSNFSLEPAISDWSLYVPYDEYSGFDTFTLWQHIPESIQNKDKDSAQIKVNGEDAGQFQRFIMVISRLLGKVAEKAVYVKKITQYDDSVDSFIRNYLSAMGFPFNEAWSSKKKQLIYEDAVWMRKFAGNYVALSAIANRFFGWKIVDKSVFLDEVFFLNVSQAILYDEVTGDPDDYRHYFDPDTDAPLNLVTYTVDYDSDPAFTSKKDDFETFMRKFIVSDLEVRWIYV